jgi:hypothetical protein
MDTLKFPITFNVDGTMSKNKSGSESQIKQLLSFVLLTEPYSLPLSPDFGTYDPTFMRVFPEALAISASKFVPEISITSIASSFDENDSRVTASFIFRNR